MYIYAYTKNQPQFKCMYAVNMETHTFTCKILLLSLCTNTHKSKYAGKSAIADH